MIVDHVGLPVGDIDRAIQFYREALGLRLLRGPVQVPPEGRVAALLSALNPGAPGASRMAHLSDVLGHGVELFEVRLPVVSPSYPSHVALSTTDLGVARREIVRAGGRLITDVVTAPRLRLCFAADPWGNLIEVVDTPYDVAQIDGQAGVA